MSARPSRASLPTFDGDAFARLKALIVERTGHHYYTDKDDQLYERIARRMTAEGIADIGAYLDRLGQGARGDAEWRRLESELTIKETFFFRFAEQFAALRTAILPALIAARSETRRLRIWSAGCSTGAEPYSIAVVLRDVLGEAIEDWHISILGTDIDEAALAAAREARYGGWSLRTLPPAERERLFLVEDGKWRLRPKYRGMARFERLNILDLLGSAAPLQLSDYDLIVCRNMLIYFHPEVATRLVGALGERLAGGGRLLLGHAEAGLVTGSGLDGVETAGVIVYRRDGPMSAPALVEPAVRDPITPPDRSPASPKRVARPAKPRAPTVPPPPDAEDDLAVVRRLLDAGDVAAAGAMIARLRADNDDGAPLHYLDAIRALAAGDRGHAERALRGALYLDGAFAMAHYVLGQELAAAGRSQQARRAYLNADRALRAGDPGSLVPEGDGRTIGELRETVRIRIAAMDAA